MILSRCSAASRRLAPLGPSGLTAWTPPARRETGIYRRQFGWAYDLPYDRLRAYLRNRTRIAILPIIAEMDVTTDVMDVLSRRVCLKKKRFSVELHQGC